jgi:hypothetical protein
LPSDKLGVGDFNNGNIYHFDLDKNRKQLHLLGSPEDKKTDNIEEFRGVIFGESFGGITDVEVGPDGYLYVLSLYQGGDNCEGSEDEDCIPYSSGVGGLSLEYLLNNEISLLGLQNTGKKGKDRNLF